MKSIYIAGGGTGGHIYPGIAIAKELEKTNYKVTFVGTEEGLESKILPKEGFQLLLLKSAKMNVKTSGLSKLRSLLEVFQGFLQACGILVKNKPDFVLGVGGYASFPMVLAAAILGVPVAIWEPNAMPGMANRILSRFVDLCFVVFTEAKSHLHSKQIIEFGMPLRESTTQVDDIPQVNSAFNILHFGGSQGSRMVGEVLAHVIQEMKWPQIAVVHQTGSVEYQKFVEIYSGNPLVQVKEFIWNMPAYYNWAHLVIGRGGASTLAEIAAHGKPSLIVPLRAADAHQEKNAQAMQARGAACMVLQKDFTTDRLRAEIERFLAHPEALDALSANAKASSRSNGAPDIAKHIVQLTTNPGSKPQELKS